MDHGTKDPKTGNELTYEVTQVNQGMEKKDKEEEDTVFSEEEQRLVKESVQRMHERLLNKKRLRRPNIKKKQRSQQNIAKLRKGLRGRSLRGNRRESQVSARGGIANFADVGIRRVGLPLQDRPIIN